MAWKDVSPDGQYVLVLIPTTAAEEERSLGITEIAQVRAIRAAYPCSGVYRNDASRNLLWKIDHYCARGNVFFSQDGQYVVIAGNGLYSGAGFQVEFLASGREPRLQMLSNCVFLSTLKGTISGGFLEPDKEQFRPSELAYIVWTKMGEKYVFDVKTGKLIRGTSPWHIGFICLLVVVMVAGVWGIRALMRMKGANDT